MFHQRAPAELAVNAIFKEHLGSQTFKTAASDIHWLRDQIGFFVSRLGNCFRISGQRQLLA